MVYLSLDEYQRTNIPKKAFNEEICFVLSNLRHMVNLEIFFIYNISINDCIESVCLKNINEITFKNTNLNFFPFDSKCVLENLKTLSIEANNIQEITPSLYPNLIFLNISYNPCQQNPTIIDSLVLLPFLEKLAIGGKHFSLSDSVMRLQQISVIEVLDIKNCDLHFVLKIFNNMDNVKEIRFMNCSFKNVKHQQIDFQPNKTYFFDIRKLNAKQKNYIINSAKTNKNIIIESDISYSPGGRHL